jgi:hypothetical protein
MLDDEISPSMRTSLVQRMWELPEEERTLILNLVKGLFDPSSLLQNILSLPPAAIIPICRIADVSQKQIEVGSRTQYFRSLIRGAHVVSKGLEKEDVRDALNQLVFDGYLEFNPSLNLLEEVPEGERAALLLITHGLREYLPQGGSRARLFPLLQLLPKEDRNGPTALSLAQFLSSDSLLHISSYNELRETFGSLREDHRAPFVRVFTPLVLDRPLYSRVKLFSQSIKILSENSLDEKALQSCVTVLSRVENEGSNTNHFSLFIKGLLKLSPAQRLMLISTMEKHAEIKTETFRVALECLRKVPEENLTEELTTHVFTILHNTGHASYNIKTILKSPDRLERLRDVVTCPPHLQEGSLKKHVKEVR